MTANNLLENVLTKINDEINCLLDDEDNENLIGNNISDELTTENYYEKSQEYLNAIHILSNNGVSVKIFLEKSLILLSKLPTIPEIEIEHIFEVIGVNRDLLKNIYIKKDESLIQLNNQFLQQSKVLVIERLHTNFSIFCEELFSLNENSLLFILKVCFDNFDYIIDEDNIHRLVLLPNCLGANIQNYKDNKNELLSYLKLTMLSEGLTFHKHFSLNTATSNQNISCDTTKVYSQYNEILYILSEYNYSNDLLNKYFLLYTIIEDFMYRKPIASMLKSGRDFSIRDFKSFYSKINNGELDKLSSLFYEIMNIDYNGNSFLNHIVTDLRQFKDTDTNDELIDFLLKIGVSNNNLSYDLLLNAGNNYKNLTGNGKKDIGYFPKIVYQLRNTILHNTATEFHITHYELDKNEVIVKVLKEFMIPMLEKIILHLIITNNELISYENNVLTLYEK